MYRFYFHLFVGKSLESKISSFTNGLQVGLLGKGKCSFACVSFKDRTTPTCKLSVCSLPPLSSGLICFHTVSNCFNQQNVSSDNTNFRADLETRDTSNEDQYAKGKTTSDKQTETDLFDCIDYEEITGGDKETLNKFKLLMLEVDVMRQDGERIPKNLSTDNWKELFALQTRSQRRKLLNFLWKVEIRQLGDLRKKEKRKLFFQEKHEALVKENENNNHIRYGFQGNTIFVRVYETTMNQFFNNRLMQAMLFGQNIVVDCGYDKNMSPMENKLCAKQLVYLFAENRFDNEPFNLHFCNMNRDSILFEKLYKAIPTIDDPSFPFNVTSEHYIDLFPKEKLVYLTPHCRTELKSFNHDDIYIIGALVDKHNNEPLSMAKAKSEGIRMAHFPIDRYLSWGLGTKSLTINQVLKILLDVRTTGDWNIALKNVPPRKVRQPGEPVYDPRKPRNRGSIIYPAYLDGRRKEYS